jgi:RNA polymerase sigma-70 factor (ECF subfamily)
MVGSRFQTTRWSLVLTARDDARADSGRALAELCQAYWHPMYAYVRRQGHRAEEARDLTQGYFLRLLEKRFLDDVRPDAGPFRAFLLASLKHFLSREREREQALKRGGGKPAISLDAEAAERRYRLEPVEHLTPDRVFERRWAQTVVDRALARLRELFEMDDKLREFELLHPHLVGDAKRGSYRDVADELEMTEGAVRVAVHRVRRRYGALLREEVAQTVADPQDVDRELRDLLLALGTTSQ